MLTMGPDAKSVLKKSSLLLLLWGGTWGVVLQLEGGDPNLGGLGHHGTLSSFGHPGPSAQMGHPGADGDRVGPGAQGPGAAHLWDLLWSPGFWPFPPLAHILSEEG